MLQSVVHVCLAGISSGMFIWLVASGLTLIFGVLRVLNFAHGSFYMLGAYVCLTVLKAMGASFTKPRNRIERMVWRQMQTILFHFSNNPVFDRRNTDRALPDLKIPPITEELVDKLIDYAIERDWGHSGA